MFTSTGWMSERDRHSAPIRTKFNNKLRRKKESNEVNIEPKTKVLKRNDNLIQNANLQSKYEGEREQCSHTGENSLLSLSLLGETVKVLVVRFANVEPD
jgi:hypothetical protein